MQMRNHCQKTSTGNPVALKTPYDVGVFNASATVRMVPQAVCFQAVVLQTACGNFTKFTTSVQLGINMK